MLYESYDYFPVLEPEMGTRRIATGSEALAVVIVTGSGAGVATGSEVAAVRGNGAGTGQHLSLLALSQNKAAKGAAKDPIF